MQSLISTDNNRIIRGSDIVFMTDDGVKFHIHSYFFTRESIYWRQILTGSDAPHHPLLRNYTATDPYIINDIDSPDFQTLIRVFYNIRYGDYSFFRLDEWLIILTFAHKWGFPHLKDLAKRYLGRLDYGVVERNCGVHCPRNVEEEHIDLTHSHRVYLVSCGHET